MCAPTVSWFNARIVLGFALARAAYRLFDVATVAPKLSWELIICQQDSIRQPGQDHSLKIPNHNGLSTHPRCVKNEVVIVSERCVLGE